ncbi:type I pullulanase [Macrococcus equipercicus]|uniref:Type I pullulanase n=1 Tax=Macrococcus equipercicus TaxID=69967 RepID=A0A9Q9BN44_9STAP|nr:type I pullulanase [Macrococcus equipercicus]KAA1042732.1 type I pullulanase [Macrococcus equipercicus]UTH14598.1 type I pullulanase [Macrococcus equipercicus]
MTYVGYIDHFTEINLPYHSVDQPDQYFHDAVISCEGITLPVKYSCQHENVFTFTTAQSIALNASWWLEFQQEKYPLHIGQIVRTAAFDEKFQQPGTAYGAIYHPEATTFTLWSPVAASADVIIGERVYPMTYEDGNWTVTLHGDFHLAEYLFGVVTNHEYSRMVDPYAKGLALNAVSGVVVNPEVEPDGFSSHTVPAIKQEESIIYEVHVRDFSMHPNSGIPEHQRGKFSAMIEAGTTTADGFSTGLDYIAALGVTHVELLPINDFARVDDVKFTANYNWGYDPVHFQTPDGSFSEAPGQPEQRLLELKQLIMTYHGHGMGIIFDVVFNHVFDRLTSSFEKLVPGYYFRYFDDLSISNGTGVGNDFASERVMARKFIIDSLLYYADYYKVDGFRFDLMGAIDVETMKTVDEALHERHPNIMLLGEGWNLNTALADEQKTVPANGHLVPHIHFFNDFFRDTLKGNNFDIEDTGYMNGFGKYNDRMYNLFTGKYDDMHVQQTINYSEVHDNHTLYDRIYYSVDRPDEDKLLLHQMTTIFTLLSQGVPFIHAGQEFFRTKYGHGNTYNLGDYMNRLNWSRRQRYDKEIAVFKKAVALKKDFTVFRMTDYQDITSKIISFACPPPVFGARLLDTSCEFIVMFNPTPESYTIELPHAGVFDMVLSTTQSSATQSYCYALEPFESVILKHVY